MDVESLAEQDFFPAHQHYYQAREGSQVYLWDHPWLRKRCGDAGNLLLDVWEPEIGNWRTTLAQHLVVIADEQVPAILIRPAERPPTCFGLGQEITLLEQTRGLESCDGLAKQDLRPTEDTPTMRLYAWGKVKVNLRAVEVCYSQVHNLGQTGPRSLLHRLARRRADTHVGLSPDPRARYGIAAR